MEKKGFYTLLLLIYDEITSFKSMYLLFFMIYLTKFMFWFFPE